MRHSIQCLFVFLAAASAINVAVEPVQVDQDAEWLRYDNGTYNWLTWGGTYRGVWFNVDDFYPGCTMNFLYQSEIWFYHHSSYPWDTSNAYIEIWNGESASPFMILDQSMITAVHAAPIYAAYNPELDVEPNFWCLVNTELSAGGWPSLLGDNMNTTVSHSFYSDDFIVWEPWTIESACNYFVAVEWVGWELEGTSWGALKSTFQ